MILAIENACMLVAVRELINDPEWAPGEVIDLILQNNGYPSAHNKILERFAPVEVFIDCSLGTEGDSLVIADADRSVTVGPQDRIVLSRRTSPGRGHAECLPVPAAAVLVASIFDGMTPNDIACLMVRRPTAPRSSSR